VTSEKDAPLDFHPEPLLKRPMHIPQRSRFPAIDAHNHLFGEYAPQDLIAVMDQTGVRTFVNVTGNAVLPYENNTYTIQRRDIRIYLDNYVKAYPGRFAALTMAEFAQWGDRTLLKANFLDRCIQVLEAHISLGALGLKITKELGLFFKDEEGSQLAVDDPRLSTIWQRCGELGVPVLVHVSDPWGFFLPPDEKNEHYFTLREFPAWSFRKSFFSKQQLLDQRDRLLARHPHTRFLLAHVANNPEDLDYVARLLDHHPNATIDFSARIDELGRQPYTARDFFIKYQDRILFGVDMPITPEIYRCHFRFLETQDEYFDYPDYIGRWGRPRWRIYGLHLPDDILRKIYFENAVALFPPLAEAS
jgi:predicted TIM-barrel fold metal-dependent hydrolase